MMRLTVIPSDNTIILNGRVLVFPFTAPAGLHAVQWNGASGTIETEDGKQVETTTLADVQPYLDAFAAESARLAAPPTLAQAIATKITELDTSYSVAMQQPVTYMGTTFQADTGSQAILTSTLVTLNAAGAVPSGFGWWDINNAKVPMTLAELNGLAGTMLNQGWAAFQNKQAKKDAARMAATVADVELVTW